jgi:hypothetical protein
MKYQPGFIRQYFLLLVMLVVSMVATAQVTDKQSDSSYFHDSYLMSSPMFDTISVDQLPQLLQFFKTHEVSKGIVYFSGAGFPNVEMNTLKGNLGFLEYKFSRLRSGSKITFQDCYRKMPDGTWSAKFGKSIYIK